MDLISDRDVAESVGDIEQEREGVLAEWHREQARRDPASGSLSRVSRINRRADLLRHHVLARTSLEDVGRVLDALRDEALGAPRSADRIAAQKAWLEIVGAKGRQIQSSAVQGGEPGQSFVAVFIDQTGGDRDQGDQDQGGRSGCRVRRDSV